MRTQTDHTEMYLPFLGTSCRCVAYFHLPLGNSVEINCFKQTVLPEISACNFQSPVLQIYIGVKFISAICPHE